MNFAGRKPIRVLAAVLAVLLIMVVAVKVFLPAEKIRDLALEQACSKLGREVSVGQVSVSLRGGLGVRLSDFVIPNPEGFGGAPFLTTRTLDLKLEFSPLLHGEFRVNRLVIDTPVLTLIRHEDGTNNFTFLPAEKADVQTKYTEKEATGNAPPPLSIAGLNLNNGQISFIDESAEKNGLQKLEMIDVTLSMALTDPAADHFRAEGKIDTDRIIVTGPANIPQLNASMDFDMTWRPTQSRLEVTQIKARVLDIPLSCSALISLGEEAPLGNIHFIMPDQPLLNLVRFLPSELGTKIPDNQNGGRINSTMDLKLTGEVDTPFVAGGKIEVQGADLNLLQPFLPPKQKGQLNGQCDLEVSFDDLKSDPAHFTYQGTLKTRGVSFTESGLVDELEDLESTLKFDNNELRVQSCRAQFASGTFYLTGSLRDPFPYFLPPEMQTAAEMKIPHLDFELHSPRLDVDRLMPAASPGGPPVASGSSKIKSRPHIDQEFPQITCQGTFAADSLIYMQMPLTNVVGKAGLKNRHLRISDVHGNVFQGRVEGEVNIDLNNLNDPLYTGQYQASAIEVNSFVSRFADLKEVLFGSCNLSGHFSTHGLNPEVIRNSLALESDAGIKQGRIITSGNVHQTLNSLAIQMGQTLNQEQRISDLFTHIKVIDGRVGLEDLNTRLGQFGDLSFGGYYAFNGDLDYQGKILLTEAQTSLIFNSGGLLGELNKLLGEKRPARLELPLMVGGTRSNPKVKLDFGSVVEDLQQLVVKEQGQRLEDEVKNQLNELLDKWK